MEQFYNSCFQGVKKGTLWTQLKTTPGPASRYRRRRMAMLTMYEKKAIILESPSCQWRESAHKKHMVTFSTKCLGIDCF